MGAFLLTLLPTLAFFAWGDIAWGIVASLPTAVFLLAFLSTWNSWIEVHPDFLLHKAFLFTSPRVHRWEELTEWPRQTPGMILYNPATGKMAAIPVSALDAETHSLISQYLAVGQRRREDH